jgi:quinolinate synthase
MITLPKLRDCLRDLRPEVLVPADIADRARGSIDRMLAISPLGATPVGRGE